MLGKLLSKSKGTTGLRVQVRERRLHDFCSPSRDKKRRIRQKTVTREKQQEA